MKITLAFLTAVATARQMASCTASGDPHYMPFYGSGKAAKFTVMGEGEYTLAKTANSDFHVSACSWDVSLDRQTATSAGKQITWNRDFQATEGGITVKVQGQGAPGAWDYTLSVTGMTGVADVTHNLGVHTTAGSWGCAASARGKTCQDFATNTTEVEVKLLRKNKNKAQGHQLVVKFPKTNRLIKANILSPTAAVNKFGRRTLFNINIKVPKDTARTMTGLCKESKTSVRGASGTDQLQSHRISSTASVFGDACSSSSTPEGLGTDELLFGDGALDGDEFKDGEIKNNDCTEAEAAAAVQACSRVNAEDVLGCLLDQLLTCNTDSVAELIQFEQDKADYTCPLNSYISASTWPLVSFDDCACMWGHTRDDDAETCTPNELSSTAVQPNPATNGACFCDGTAPRHCMHNNDGSCGLPVKLDGTDCTNPVEASNSALCTCSEGTTDCTGSKVFVQFSTQPSMATPASAFGQQPVVKLVDATGAVVHDSKTKVRISIANVQSEECRGCNEQKPCLHDNVGDNTCHQKHDLFGDQVCPAGTTECLPKQSTAKLYQDNAEENPDDANSLYRKTRECRMEDDTTTSKSNFCSGMTPCKHKNDGSCVQKTAFYSQKVEEEPVNTNTCKGTAFWRRAVPSPVTGWFFTTDSTCTMEGEGALGCSDGHSYAMDKWCDHNCHPKYPGQPAFCPESHCDCTEETAPPTPETPDWRCPANRLNDGTCRCTPGTEFCGAIETTLVNGVGAFDHLTIGTEGRYQLLVEVVMPDQNTGSNNVRVTVTSSVFDVVYPKTRGTTCRAQSQWRQPAMYDSQAHGEGQAWFYEDSKKCLNRNNDGTCGTVDTDVEYAMDKWCKANNCAAHTLESHCEFYTPASSDTTTTNCASQKYDMFGDCCHANNVDACGVCGGDGSTCKVTSYMAAPVAVNGDTDVIFNAIQADSSCDIKTPCMHLNDGTCLPKTFNSAQLVGENQHCFWDRYASAAAQSNWKYGTWDVEGRLSKSILRQIDVATDSETGLIYPLSTGNQDCYCSAGTIDISKKLELEDRAKEDFVDTLTEKVNKIQTEVTDGVNPPEVQLLANSKDAVAYNTAGCEGQSVPLSSIHNNILCGTHWTGSGSGTCTGRGRLSWTFSSDPSNTCCNDQVRSIMIPAMTTAKLYKNCYAPNDAKQVRYPTLENFETTAKCVDVPDNAKDFSAVVLEGNVLKVDAQVVGTEADYFESQCHPYVEKCLDDTTCKDALEAAETLVSGSSSDFLAALKDLAPAAVNMPFKNLLVCSGLVAFGLEPTPDSLTDAVTDAVTDAADAVSDAADAAADAVADVVAPIVSRCKMIRPIQAIQPVVAKRTESMSRFANRVESLWSRRRLTGAAGTTTAVVQVSTSGNQGAIGAATTSPASAAQFAAGSSATQGASASGIGAAGTALIAIGCVGVALAVVGGLATRKKSMSAPKQQVTNSDAVTQKAANEDQTDVL